MKNLPNELLLDICEYLDYWSLKSIKYVNRRFYTLIPPRGVNPHIDRALFRDKPDPNAPKSSLPYDRHWFQPHPLFKVLKHHPENLCKHGFLPISDPRSRFKPFPMPDSLLDENLVSPPTLFVYHLVPAVICDFDYFEVNPFMEATIDNVVTIRDYLDALVRHPGGFGIGNHEVLVGKPRYLLADAGGPIPVPVIHTVYKSRHYDGKEFIRENWEDVWIYRPVECSSRMHHPTDIAKIIVSRNGRHALTSAASNYHYGDTLYDEWQRSDLEFEDEPESSDSEDEWYKY